MAGDNEQDALIHRRAAQEAALRRRVAIVAADVRRGLEMNEQVRVELDELRTAVVNGAQTYLALVGPTNAQVVAQVRALTQAVQSLAVKHTQAITLLTREVDYLVRFAGRDVPELRDLLANVET